MALAWNGISHYTYNNGYGERFEVREPGLMRYDRVGWNQLIQQAQKPEGAQLSDNILLKITAYSCHTFAYQEFYEAMLYSGKEPFLITLGGGKNVGKRVCHRARNLGDKYKVCSPLPEVITGPLVLDILLPSLTMDAVAFLYSGECFKFTRNLGRALLYPESIRI